jgi:hypothetical protein
MTGEQRGQTHLRDDACDRHSIIGVCECTARQKVCLDICAKNWDRPNSNCTSYCAAAAAAVHAERLLEHAGKQQVWEYEELAVEQRWRPVRFAVDAHCSR